MLNIRVSGKQVGFQPGWAGLVQSSSSPSNDGTSTLPNAQGDPDGCSAVTDPAAQFFSNDPRSNLPANVNMVLCPNENTNPHVFAFTGLSVASANEANSFLNTVDSSLQAPRDASNEIPPSETAPPTSSSFSVRHDMGNDGLTPYQSIVVDSNLDSNSSRPATSVPSGALDETGTVASVLLAAGNDFPATATVDQIIPSSNPPSPEDAIPTDLVQSDSLRAVDSSSQLANSDSLSLATMMHSLATEAEPLGQLVNETAPPLYPICLDPGKDSLSLSRTAATADFTDETQGHTIPTISSSPNVDSAMNRLINDSTTAVTVDLGLSKAPIFIMPEDRQLSTQQASTPAPVSPLDLTKSNNANIGVALSTSYSQTGCRQSVFAKLGTPASSSNPETSCESQNGEFEGPAIDVEDVDMGVEDIGLDDGEGMDISMTDEARTGLTPSKILGSAVYRRLKDRPVNCHRLLVNPSINSCYYTEGSLLQ